jgi:hypothetical protein
VFAQHIGIVTPDHYPFISPLSSACTIGSSFNEALQSRMAHLYITRQRALHFSVNGDLSLAGEVDSFFRRGGNIVPFNTLRTTPSDPLAYATPSANCIPCCTGNVLVKDLETLEEITAMTKFRNILTTYGTPSSSHFKYDNNHNPTIRSHDQLQTIMLVVCGCHSFENGKTLRDGEGE